MFYKSVVESVLMFGLLNWYGGSSSQARSKVKRVVTSARRLGCSAPSLEELYNKLLDQKCKHILNDSSHPILNIYLLKLDSEQLNVALSVSENPLYHQL